ncbi:glycine betaine ABC transporter substrate-binding protein [Dyella sp. KRB-257]|uniref:glycine betaine ABC transporter substrate-binding protein n=1 Tax=Dyella sp. KRB-257 TaxID=3400915 RepID=UPI003C05CFEC
MKMKPRFGRFAPVPALALAIAVAGCSPSGSPSSGASAPASSASAPAASGIGTKEIKLAYVEWASCVAATNVARAALEQKGYDVQTVSVSAAAMYAAVADGDADATVCAWLPSTQANYYARTRDKLDNLGPNLVGTRLGLVVPDYVTIDSIPELADHADQFQDRIVGIDPGAGEMGLTQKVIEQYKLPLKLMNGSGATMTAALKSAIDNHQWIVVTGWTPHWMWARFKLKYLADPKGIYGNAENIDTLVRQGLRRDSPDAYALLDGFHWTPEQMQQVMDAGREPGARPYDVAKQWFRQHGDVVAGWSH